MRNIGQKRIDAMNKLRDEAFVIEFRTKRASNDSKMARIIFLNRAYPL